MGFFDTILSPIMVAVAWIMVRVHDLLVFVGMSEGSGWAWVLSIVGLTVVIRILIIPLFFKQIKASRSMQLVQPEMQKLQKKYKNKTDPASRQKMQEEMMALYREHGANPFSSCLPILLQMPIFFALFRVLNSLGPLAQGTYAGGDHIGPLDQQLAAQAESSTLFGAPISETFLQSTDVTVKVVTAVLIVLMSVTTFTTQRQLTMKNMPASALDNPMARQQRMLMYILPLIFAFSGVNFPIGVLIYWTVSNLWSMGQQFYTIRKQPAPGSEAARLREERLAKKRARRGLPPVDEEQKAAEEQPRGGQRVQPKRKDRAKKPTVAQPAGTTGASAASADVAAAEDDELEETGDGEQRGKDGLTAAERAQKRYEERAAQRRAAAAKRKPQGKKKK
jgi:YidC/Oxa1 family membrane protein insertase